MTETREPGCDDDVVTPIRTGIGIPVSELLEEEIPPAEWIVPGYVQEANIAVLAGPPGAGKTLLAFDWCSQCVAAGRRVFLAQNEGGKKALQERLRRSCAAAGILPPPPIFTYRRNLELSLKNMQSVVDFSNELVFYELIVLDSLASFWPGLNENDPEHMGLVAEALKIICEATGAAVVGIHHTTKAAWKPGEKPSLADIRGHGTLGGRIDAAFICVPMERVAGSVRFELHTVKQRDEDWSAPQAVDVLMTGDAAIVTHEPLDGSSKTPIRAGGKKPKRSYAELKLAIVEMVKLAPEPITGNAIYYDIGGTKTTFLGAVRELVDSDHVLQRVDGDHLVVRIESNQFGTNGSGAPKPAGSVGSLSNRERETPNRDRTGSVRSPIEPNRRAGSKDEDEL